MSKNSEVKKTAGSGFRVLLSLACVIVVVAGLKSSSEFFIPVFLGLFLAILSMPVLKWLMARGVPRPLAIVMTIAVDLLVLGGIVYIASGVIPEFQDKRVVYAENLRKLTSDFSETMDHQLERFSGFWTHENTSTKTGDSLPDSQSPDGEVAISPQDKEDAGVAVDGEKGAKGPSNQPIPTFQELFERYWDTNRIVAAIGGADVVARFTSLTTKAFFALVIMIFILSESGRYSSKVKQVRRVGGPDLSRFKNSSQDIQKYLAIKTGASAVTGVLAAIACSIVGVDFPVLWGLVAFLFNYVPAIGSIVAGIPPVILALMETGGWPALAIMICYLVINITIGNFIEPMLLGKRFGISTVVVILSVMMWGYIWGPVGMFLAVPLTMMVKVMLDNSSDLRWISVMMGKGASDEELRNVVAFEESASEEKKKKEEA